MTHCCAAVLRLKTTDVGSNSKQIYKTIESYSENGKNY